MLVLCLRFIRVLHSSHLWLHFWIIFGCLAEEWSKWTEKWSKKWSEKWLLWMLWNANILKMKQKCILPSPSSAWHIQTPPQRTSRNYYYCKFIGTISMLAYLSLHCWAMGFIQCYNIYSFILLIKTTTKEKQQHGESRGPPPYSFSAPSCVMLCTTLYSCSVLSSAVCCTWYLSCPLLPSELFSLLS